MEVMVNLLRKIFIILIICVILGSQSYAMQTPIHSLKKLMEMPLHLFRNYRSSIITNAIPDEKIFFTAITAAKMKLDMGMLEEPTKWFNLNGIYSETKQDCEKLQKIIDTLFEEDFVVKKDYVDFNFKQSLQDIIGNITINNVEDADEVVSSGNKIDEDSLEDNNAVNSKFSSIVQTFRNSKLVLGGTMFCVAVLTGCAYVWYKNSKKIKKENDKKEDDEVKEDMQQKEENVEVRKN